MRREKPVQAGRLRSRAAVMVAREGEIVCVGQNDIGAVRGATRAQGEVRRWVERRSGS